MPADKDQQAARRDAIVSILRDTAITSQTELVRSLETRGFTATQSSVSRDLHELGVAKVRGRYRTRDAVDDSPPTTTLAGVAHFVQGAAPAGPNLTVVRTAIGGAQSVGLAIDAAAWPEVVGTIAGDDTLFVATKNGAAQRRLITKLEGIARSESGLTQVSVKGEAQ